MKKVERDPLTLLTVQDIAAVERDVAADLGFRYQATSERPEESAYFDELEIDKVEILAKAKAFFENVLSEGAEILPSKALAYFFDGLEGSLDLTAEIKEEITGVFAAVRRVSRELKPGAAQDELDDDSEGNDPDETSEVREHRKKLKDDDRQYTREDLRLARRIYDQLLRGDLAAGRVTHELLRLARDPK